MKHNQILTILLCALCAGLLCLALSSGPSVAKTSQRQSNLVARGSDKSVFSQSSTAQNWTGSNAQRENQNGLQKTNLTQTPASNNMWSQIRTKFPRTALDPIGSANAAGRSGGTYGTTPEDHQTTYKKSIINQPSETQLASTGNALVASSKGKLSLFVRDGITGYGVKSEILFSSSKDSYLLSTNEGGILEFVADSGRFDLTINTPGYKQVKTFFSIPSNEEVKTNIWLDRELNDAITKTENESNESTAVIKGYVVDGSSGKPIEGVNVYFTTIDKNIKTDKNGYFRIESEIVSKLEGGQDDNPRRVKIEFTKESFRDYAIEKFLLGTGVVTLRITLEKGQDKVIENYVQSILDKQNENADIYEQPGSNQEQKFYGDEEKSDVTSLQSCPTLPTTIRVGTGCPTSGGNPVCNQVCTGTVQVMSLESYVQSGLDNEWISSWAPASLQAGAVAYRTYGAYYVKNQPLQNPNYDIRSDTCNQAWGPATAASCINAANATVGEVIVNSSNVIVKSEYSAENNNAGCGNGFSGTGNDWPCISDNVCSGFPSNGHGRGMCQYGSSRWAAQGQTYTWILDHYYNPGNYYRCGSGGQPSPTPTLTARSVSSTNVLVNQPFTVSTTLSVSNGTADHAGISISLPSLTSSGVSGTPPNESYNSTQGTVTTASSSSITGGSTLQYYGSGESLTCGSSSTCPAQHLLVEGDWVTVGAGNTRSLNLTVTPKVAGTFKVRIRGWVTAPGYQNPSRDPSSGSVDQQNFPVYEVTVNVSATPTDSTSPNLTINSHSNGQTVSSSTITLSGTASDSGRGNNGISSVTVNGVSASGGSASGSATANWSRNLTLSQGANNITVVARDNSSNLNSTTQSITVNYQPVDSTGPNLSINSHSNGETVSSSAITLFGTASDSGRGNNGISSVTVNGAGASGGTVSGSGTANWSRSLTLSQGTNNITVVARDNSSNQNSTTQSITLYYQPIQTYTIAVSASPSAGGTVGGGGTFAAGSSRTVTASAASNYSFVNWTENGSVVSSSASYPFTLNGNRTLVANFSLVSSSNASYDSTLKAPKCLGPGSVCDSGTLLNGRGDITGGAEPNQPNTIFNSCADNMVGSYHSDESIDRIRISTLDGSSFAPGKTVKIEVTVWAFSETDDYLDLFYTDDATNPSWTYMTTLSPSITGEQVLSTTFTLPSGGSLQAVRANFLYQGAPTPCSGGSDNYDDHDDLVFAVGSVATQSIQLLLEEFGPSPSQAAAVDSMLFFRDPFPVVNGSNLLNLGIDRNTRVIIFATNLQLTQGETSSSVVVNLIDSSGISYDIAAEDVRPVPNSNFTQVIFRLPNNLPIGTCTIKVKAHGQVSNAGTIRIRI